MPEYIVRQVSEARIDADNIDLANHVGSTLLSGDPPPEDIAGWKILEEPTVKVFVVEED